MSIAEMGPEQKLARPRHSDSALGHAAQPPRLFRSFWMGGFESACQFNTLRQRIDMIAATQHDVQAASDYALLRSLGMRVARDGLRWPLIEARPGHYDFASFAPMLQAAQDAGIQVVWGLCHYGWPDDLDLFSPRFVERFARFAHAAATFIRNHSDPEGGAFYTPMNEISFLSWAIGTKGIIHPVAIGRGWEAKCQLVRAAIAAMDAVREVDPRARFCHVDPVIHVVCPRERPDLAHSAREQHEWQWLAWDMIAGRVEPALGGHPRYLDIVGVNYYHSNQFEHPDVRLRWEDHPRDERFVPFHQLLEGVWRRYGRPVFVAETSHFGAGRARWLHEMAEEICTARLRGVPLEGVCLYPFLDRPDWEDPDHWHNSGLVDVVRGDEGILRRVIHQEYALALRQAQGLMAQHGCA